MSDKVLNEADQAFYEWYHVQGLQAVPIEMQREVFMAGWTAHLEAGTSE